MDNLDRACAQALRKRRAAYNAWRRDPSPRTHAAYAAAFDLWRQAVAPCAARQPVWRAERRGTLLAALKHAVRPAGRKVLAPR